MGTPPEVRADYASFGLGRSVGLTNPEDSKTIAGESSLARPPVFTADVDRPRFLSRALDVKDPELTGCLVSLGFGGRVWLCCLLGAVFMVPACPAVTPYL